MYGNMSSVEKQLNKNDLQAYKNYDTQQYSLVAGVHHQKHAFSPKSSTFKKSANEWSQASDQPELGNSIELNKSKNKLDLKMNHLQELGYDQMQSLNSVRFTRNNSFQQNSPESISKLDPNSWFSQPGQIGEHEKQILVNS